LKFAPFRIAGSGILLVQAFCPFRRLELMLHLLMHHLFRAVGYYSKNRNQTLLRALALVTPAVPDAPNSA